MDETKIIEAIKIIKDHYGEETQAHKTIEELNELAVAIAHQDVENIHEEMADVFIMFCQLQLFEMFNYEKFWDIVNSKLERQLNRIDSTKVNKQIVLILSKRN